MKSTMMDFPLTLNHLIDRAGQIFRSVEVVSQMPYKVRRRHTYAEIRRRVRALAQGLLGQGLRPGDRVATLMSNHHVHLEVYFGVPMAGGVYHTLNMRLAPEDLAYIVNHAEDRFLIVDDILLPLLAKFIDSVNFERIFVVSTTGSPLEEGLEDYEGLLEGAREEWLPPPVDERQAAGMCYTSGTTGHPKGVVYSHRAIVLQSLASGLPDTLGLRQDDVVVPVVPMFHVNAWGLPFTAAMIGASLVFPGPYLDPESLLDLYAAEGVTVAAGVPTIWQGILRELGRQPGRWKLTPGMRMIVGGSAIPESMLRSFEEHGIEVVHAWGMTETAPLGTVARIKRQLRGLPADERYSLRAKQGIPAPFVEIRSMAEDREAPWDGQRMGELQVRGPWVAGAYHDSPEAAGSWTEDGWFRTGDIVTIDPEGYVQIVDRAKDLIKSGGEWISSLALEAALMSHASVAEAAVVAIPDEKWMERPLAVIAPKEGCHAPEAELRELLARQFPKWWIPDAFAFQEHLPKGATGKILKSALRDRYKSWNQPQQRNPGETP